MSKALMNLYDALNRLKSNTPLNVQRGSKINNDTVALEAGLKRGAVKRSRPELAELLDDIKEAESNRVGKEYNKNNAKITMQKETLKLKNKLIELQEKYDQQLAQINNLIFENHRLKQELKSYTYESNSDKVIKFNNF